MTQQFPPQPYQSPVPPRPPKKRMSGATKFGIVAVAALLVFGVVMAITLVVGIKGDAAEDAAQSQVLDSASQANAQAIADTHCETAALANNKAWQRRNLYPGSSWPASWPITTKVAGVADTWRAFGERTKNGQTVETYVCEVAYTPGLWTATVYYNGDSGQSSQRVG